MSSEELTEDEKTEEDHIGIVEPHTETKHKDSETIVHKYYDTDDYKEFFYDLGGENHPEVEYDL